MNRSVSTVLVLVFVLALAHSSPISAQNDETRFIRWLKWDIVSIGKGFDGSTALTFGSIGTGLAAISLADETSSKYIRSEFQNSDMLQFANYGGDKHIVMPVSAGLFASSLLTNDSKFQNAAFTSLQSVILTWASISAGKFLFARSRPPKREGAHDFDFFESAHTSFPSGHTGRAFAFITPWVMYYPHPVTYSLMALPVGTAVARVAKGKHWVSDVAAGAAIGFSIGYQLSKRHQFLKTEKIRLKPVVSINSFRLKMEIDL